MPRRRIGDTERKQSSAALTNGPSVGSKNDSVPIYPPNPQWIQGIQGNRHLSGKGVPGDRVQRIRTIGNIEYASSGQTKTAEAKFELDGKILDSRANTPTVAAKGRLAGGHEVRDTYSFSDSDLLTALHLVNGRLGGPGNDHRNLAWGTQHGNLNIMYPKCEKEAQEIAQSSDNKGKKMDYQVKMLYDYTENVPGCRYLASDVETKWKLDGNRNWTTKKTALPEPRVKDKDFIDRDESDDEGLFDAHLSEDDLNFLQEDKAAAKKRAKAEAEAKKHAEARARYLEAEDWGVDSEGEAVVEFSSLDADSDSDDDEAILHSRNQADILERLRKNRKRRAKKRGPLG